MIACVSPAEVNLQESLNALRYANRARNIQVSQSDNSGPNGSFDRCELGGPSLVCVRCGRFASRFLPLLS
jgi:hypothetical protein